MTPIPKGSPGTDNEIFNSASYHLHGHFCFDSRRVITRPRFCRNILVKIKIISITCTLPVFFGNVANIVQAERVILVAEI